MRSRRGLALFNNPGKGNCTACHPSKAQGYSAHALFTDFTYDNIGVPRNWNVPANLPTPRSPISGLPLDYLPSQLNVPADAEYAYYDLGLCGPFAAAAERSEPAPAVHRDHHPLRSVQGADAAQRRGHGAVFPQRRVRDAAHGAGVVRHPRHQQQHRQQPDARARRAPAAIRILPPAAPTSPPAAPRTRTSTTICRSTSTPTSISARSPTPRRRSPAARRRR